MRANDENNELDETRAYWDQEAASFDDQPDHGLHNPAVRAAWTQLLRENIPLQSARVLDAGCGTGSLSVLLAGFGHRVTGIDLSPAMVALAVDKAKKSGVKIDFHVMNAASPQFSAQSFDVLLSRHLLWALPEPARVLQRWMDFIKPEGYILLIEGFWHTGGGLHLDDVLHMLPGGLRVAATQNLSTNPNLWGEPVADERYLLLARKAISAEADC